jgi:hypothetical protein
LGVGFTNRKKARGIPFGASRLFLCLLAASSAYAQDLRTVTSPNGQLEFRLFVGQPADSGLARLAYQIFFSGKRIIDTSYLGIDIVPQEPLLGQNVGLIGSSTAKGAGYNELRANYMQNGSLGRLLDIEVRVSDDEIRFRYLIPRSTPLEGPFTIDDEKTEFAIEPGMGKMLKIGEDRGGNYPPMTLVREEDSVLVTHLDSQFETTAPLTTAWRTITLTR